MKYFYCLLLLLSYSLLKAQATLINSGNDALSIANNATKIDSLKIQSKDQASYRQVQQNANKPVDVVGVKEDKFNEKFLDVSRNNVEINKISPIYINNSKQVEETRRRLIEKEIALKKERGEKEKLKAENAVFRLRDSLSTSKNLELSFNINAIKAISNNRNNFNDIINSRRDNINDIVKSLKGNKDSLLNIKSLVENTIGQIASREFRVSSVYTLYDTSFTRKNKEVIIDSLSNLTEAFAKYNYRTKELIDDIKNTIINIDRLIEESLSKDSLLNDYSDLAKRLINKSDTVSADFIKKALVESSTIEDLLKNFTVSPQNKGLIKSRIENKDYSKRFIAIKNDFDSTVKRYNSFYEKNLTRSSKDVEESEFGALPNVTSLIGEQRALNLNISILGSYTKKNTEDFNVIEAKLFTGNVPNSLATPRSLFIPEISTFGTQIKYVKGANAVLTTSQGQTIRQFASTVSGNFELNLLSKRLLNGVSSTTVTSPNTNTSVTSLNNFVIHARGGGEVVLLKEVFSIYANINWVSIIDNVQSFQQQFSGLTEIDKKTSWVFFDVGCRVLLNPAGAEAKKYTNSGFNIVADFNLIIPKIWGRQLVNGTNDVSQTDMFIPLIRLGIRKSLSTFSKK